MKYIYNVCLLSVLLNFMPTIINAQTVRTTDQTANTRSPFVYEQTYPLHEIRAVWLTTLQALDWPKAKATDASGIERQKAELCRILDQYVKANINTVILQTRVRGTVIYPSKIEPWDECITGRPGRAPGYDPLAYVVEECHKRGLELHCWVVSIPLGKTQRMNNYGASSVMKRHPELCKTVGGEIFMIPGKPETADYIASICREIVENYDVDGISLDYIRYPESVYKFSDDEYYPKGSGMSRADWKRENITRIVRRVHDVVKPIKPWVKLSSSPIGKYRDLSRYSSKGWNCYDAVWQDPQKWLKDNIQDVLFPMMYFKENHFYPFVFNWCEGSHGHPVVPGLGIYFLDPREGKWVLDDIRAQMYTCRKSGIGGVAFYRSDFLTRNCKGLFDATCNEICPYPAQSIPMTWMGCDEVPPVPEHVVYSNDRLTWNRTDWDREVLYNVYASCQYPVDVTKAENLMAVNVRDAYWMLNERAARNIYFAVTSVDRFGNESKPTQIMHDNIKLLSDRNVAQLIARDLGKDEPVDDNKGKKKKNKTKTKTKTKTKKEKK